MQICRALQKPSRKIRVCRCAEGDRDEETGDRRSSGQQNYYDSTITSTPTEYTTLGVSLHSADTGWRWRHASVASPTAADAHTLRHRKSALCMLFVFFLLLWQNIWQQQLWKGRVYVGSRGEEIVHHGGENVATANTEWVFPPQLNSQDLTRITLSPLEKTIQIKWAVMRTLWSFFVLVFLKAFFLCFVVAVCSMNANSWMMIIPRSLCVKGLFTPRWCFWELEPLGSGA